jgi:hypothetical protein
MGEVAKYMLVYAQCAYGMHLILVNDRYEVMNRTPTIYNIRKVLGGRNILAAISIFDPLRKPSKPVTCQISDH